MASGYLDQGCSCDLSDGGNGHASRLVAGLADEESRRVVSSIRDAMSVEAIYVFGSRARGDYGPDSDVDIFIIADDDSNWAHAKARAALSWLKMPKDVLVESRGLYQKGAARFGYVEHEVASEGVKLYG